MAKFDAGTAVEAMEYDFTAYGGSSGTIPEPSEETLDLFMKKIREVALEARRLVNQKGDPNDLSPEDMLNTLSEMDEDTMTKSLSVVSDALAELCSGTPTAEEISRLPFRVRQAFTGWLVGQFRPEARTAATTS